MVARKSLRSWKAASQWGGAASPATSAVTQDPAARARRGPVRTRLNAGTIQPTDFVE